MQEFFDIVDDNGTPTGEIIDRATAHEQGIPHRTAHVWLLRHKNGHLQVLLQKRSATKDSYPNCYDISSAGHIPAGVDYVPSALRELQEELGLTVSADALIHCGDLKISGDEVFYGKPFHDQEYARVFVLWNDQDETAFQLQEEEVAGIRWMDFEECLEGVRTQTLHHCLRPDELALLQHYIDTVEGR